MQKQSLFGFAVGLAAIAGPVAAAPTFVVSLGDQLFVRTGNVQTQHTLSDAITAMAVSPNGTIYATSSTDGGNGTFELYTIDDVNTSPSLTLVGDFLTENTPSLSFIGNTLYAFQEVTGNSPTTRLITIDTGALTESVVGQDGFFLDFAVGSGYDSSSDTLYALNKGAPGSLYTVDYNVVAPTNPIPALVGATNQRMNNHGGEFFGGKMYAAVQDVVALGDGLDTIQLNLGEVNTGTGDMTYFANVITDFDPLGANIAVGLAVIPTPGVATVLAFGAAGFVRRRR